MLRQNAVKGESEGTFTKIKTENNFTITADKSKKLDGPSKGPSPIDLFLSSLIGCINITGSAIAKDLGFTIEQASFDVKTERDERGHLTAPFTQDAPVTSALLRVWGTVYVETEGTQEQLNQVSEIIKKRCPIARLVVDSGCKYEIEWKKI